VIHLGIVVALPAEARCIAGYSRSQRAGSTALPAASGNTMLEISGSGPEQAARCAGRLVEHGAAALLSWGCAGALSSRLFPGDLLLPRHVSAANGQTLHTDEAWRARLVRSLNGILATHQAGIAESPMILLEPAQKRALNVASNCEAVDMESAAVACVARKAGLPFMAIRAIADRVDERLPRCIAKAMDNHGNIGMRPFMSAAIFQPESWPALVRLGWHFHAALRTLRCVSKQATPLYQYPG